VKNGRAKQYAALPFRGAPGTTEVLLLTSRGTGRWVFSKGWAERGLKGHELAAKEAFEEAGIVGKVLTRAIGAYTYDKDSLELVVRVYPMEVERLLDDWPEKAERKREWFSLAQAATLVDEGELVMLLLRLSAQDIEAGDPTTWSPSVLPSTPATSAATASLRR
jgi:8-oxo-dGTP pyrophosphatase MutT (NUDIX family)